MKILICLLSSILLLIYFAEASPLSKNVPVYVYAALAELNSFVPEASRQEFIHYIQLSEKVANEQGKKCGYHFKFSMFPFAYSDNIGFYHSVNSLPKENGPWLIIGPKQSNQYTLLAAAAKDTPTISPMASSKEIFELGPFHKTLGISNRKLVEELLRSIPKIFNVSLKRKTYISVLRSGSLNSKDFIEEFDKAGKQIGLIKENSFELISDYSDMAEIKAWVSKSKPDYILLPVKGDLAALVIQALHPLSPSSIFIGGDSWGDGDVGSLSSMDRKHSLRAIMVRPFAPAKIILQSLKSRDLIAQEVNGHLQMAAGLSYSIIGEQLATFACQYKPQSSAEFKIHFLEKANLVFKAVPRPAVYIFREGRIEHVAQ